MTGTPATDASPSPSIGLLEVAESLARGFSGTAPATTAALRRSVSTAYYAVFGTFVARAVKVMVPDATIEEGAKVSRVLSHQGLARAAVWVERGQVNQLPEHLREAVAPMITRASEQPAVVTVAIDFRALYGARLNVDYNPIAVADRVFAQDQCRAARSMIEVIKSTDPPVSDAIDAWCRAVWLSR